MPTFFYIGICVFTHKLFSAIQDFSLPSLASCGSCAVRVQFTNTPWKICKQWTSKLKKFVKDPQEMGVYAHKNRSLGHDLLCVREELHQSWCPWRTHRQSSGWFLEAGNWSQGWCWMGDLKRAARKHSSTGLAQDVLRAFRCTRDHHRCESELHSLFLDDRSQVASVELACGAGTAQTPVGICLSRMNWWLR